MRKEFCDGLMTNKRENKHLSLPGKKIKVRNDTPQKSPLIQSKGCIIAL